MYAPSNTGSTLPSPSPLMHHSFPELTEFETLSQLNNSETSYYYNSHSCGSGYSSYGGSPISLASPTLMQRSVSSHSLQFHHHNSGTHHPFTALFAELLDSDDAPVRRTSSTGDLQGVNGMQQNHHLDSPLSSESSMIIEGMSRACRYSPEEKKVRIERYRSKRNQRNFNKKIKYACRKTLADSRPRIRGRFARNDETEKNTTIQWSQIGGGEEEDEEDENWVSVLDSIVAANLVQESQGSSSYGLLY
ncbi:zinc finger protein CONSTANS-LIKE 2-like [Abrus precatorius]|uniref:Zinc finger protein CONSTANS-LIKE 2-like n=1 Tax=Abrus precatorius TaxID=3816 RepID=A0A8B8KL77_ABRPR|nr:zinc finger protein CONSTANS-LIKE 2-like [Abrus precatorius]